MIRKNIISILVITVNMTLLFLWMFFFQKQFMLGSMLIIISTLILCFAGFEFRKPKLRDIVLSAVMIAVAVAGRVIFYVLPQFKPMTAIIIVTGICLGPDVGFLVGASSAFVSNMVFTQGVWTPFQMISFGTIGFVAGLFRNSEKITRRPYLCALGFVCGCFIYGLLVEGSTIIFLDEGSSLLSILAVYARAIPANVMHGLSTVFFLWLFGPSFIRKLRRVISKYGIQE